MLDEKVDLCDANLASSIEQRLWRPAPGSMSGVGMFGVLSERLLEHRLVKLVPIVEIVQVHCVFWRRSVIGNAARAENTRARFVVVIVAAHRSVVLFDRV